ncbi:MAG: class II fructose-bisphosphate aldolase [Actinobacteria bacterium]|nr:class II fructose-bisphosphate aldolase [Actinomycetota bacterium]
MALISLKEILSDAKQKKYGVFATNAFSFEMAEVIVEAAEEKNSPVILMMAEDLFKFLNPERTASAIISMIKDAKVPVVFHLDHGNNFDVAMKCIRWGLSSIMFDGSNLPLKENIKIVKELKRISIPSNISVEAEVGYVGGLEAREKTEGQEGIDTNDYTKVEDAVRFVNETDVDALAVIDTNDYTKVEDAVRFVNETGVDALAVAVGTIHGVFRFKPNLDFDRIKEIKDAVETPLVLHGSSGLSDEDFKKAISCGITKINYFTGLVTEAGKKAKEIACGKNDFTYMMLNKSVMEAVKEKIKKKMDLFGSTGKA